MEKWKVFCALVGKPLDFKKISLFYFWLRSVFFFAVCWLSLVVWSRSYSQVLGSRGYSL